MQWKTFNFFDVTPIKPAHDAEHVSAFEVTISAELSSRMLNVPG